MKALLGATTALLLVFLVGVAPAGSTTPTGWRKPTAAELTLMTQAAKDAMCQGHPHCSVTLDGTQVAKHADQDPSASRLGIAGEILAVTRPVIQLNGQTAGWPTGYSLLYRTVKTPANSSHAAVPSSHGHWWVDGSSAFPVAPWSTGITYRPAFCHYVRQTFGLPGGAPDGCM